MTNRFFTPNVQFLDNTGVPYAGGFLYFYLTGTSTPQNTYSDSSLAVPNTNPVVLDSAGDSGNIFLAAAAYKVILKDSNGVTIWTADPVWSSDYSTVAQFAAWNGTPNGAVAGTAGTQGGRPSSVIWDYTNNILYVCTTTGTTSTAVWTAVNSSATPTNNVQPMGYLAFNSGEIAPTANVVANTTLVYTPYLGNVVPIFNGTAFTSQVFTELTLTLASAHAASTIYDVFVFSNSGVLTLATGPAWSVSTAGSGARGTGAGTTQISRNSGIWVNTVQMAGRNGSTTYTISANLATYLGSIFIDTSAGQISGYVTWGQSRKWAIWNAYNRRPLYLKAGDSTATWDYTLAVIRPSNNATANSLTVFQGLAEENYDFGFQQRVTNGTAGVNVQYGIGFNSTTAFSGTSMSFGMGANDTQSTDSTSHPPARFLTVPSLGVNVITSLEYSVATGTSTWKGTEAKMLLWALWRG